MFGYATDETEELMPLTHVLATKIGYKLTEVRKNGTVPWLRPDGKTQVTVEYRKEDGAMIPQRVHTILISTQHAPGEVPLPCHTPFAHKRLQQDLHIREVNKICHGLFLCMVLIGEIHAADLVGLGLKVSGAGQVAEVTGCCFGSKLDMLCSVKDTWCNTHLIYFGVVLFQSFMHVASAKQFCCSRLTLYFAQMCQTTRSTRT